MKWKYDDGGRAAAGFKGKVGDCVVRAIAIATRLSYQTVYKEIYQCCMREKPHPRQKKPSHPERGVNKNVYRDYLLNELGWVWHPIMKIGTGCTVHLKAEELPKGRIIAKVSVHLVAVIDGVIHDTHDCTRDESRCVYGFYAKS